MRKLSGVTVATLALAVAATGPVSLTSHSAVRAEVANGATAWAANTASVAQVAERSDGRAAEVAPAEDDTEGELPEGSGASNRARRAPPRRSRQTPRLSRLGAPQVSAARQRLPSGREARSAA